MENEASIGKIDISTGKVKITQCVEQGKIALISESNLSVAIDGRELDLSSVTKITLVLEAGSLPRMQVFYLA